jgi:UDP-glucuronate 4-epimerase
MQCTSSVSDLQISVRSVIDTLRKFFSASNRVILLTGALGFCGFHVWSHLIARGHSVCGVDSVSAYYDPAMKRARLAALGGPAVAQFEQIDVTDAVAIRSVFSLNHISSVIHLAAQPGVRRSLTHPEDYVQANLVGFANVLEAARQAKVEHFVYASSSSVYGANVKAPFSERDSVDHPVSLYAATKKANELMAHAYSHLYDLPTTGLRFFTVYGAWGRPDMAPWLFTDAIMQGKPINVFNHGELSRDFTYVEDVAEAVVRLLDKPPARDHSYDFTNPRPDQSDAPYRVLNVGNEKPVQLLDFIRELESALGKKATLNFLPMQAGDVYRTEADVTELRQLIGYAPSTPIDVGLAKWAAWYKRYHGIE